MIGLCFNRPPQYVYSNSRQFLPQERHMDRIFDEDVLILMRKGTLRFWENGTEIQLSAGEYYLQRASLVQEGREESDIPNYYFIHFHGFFREGGHLPIRGKFNEEHISKYVKKIEDLGIEAPALEYQRWFFAILSELAKQQNDDSLADNVRSYLLQNYMHRITLEDIGKAFFLTKNQIIYLFRSTYGKTPHRYLMDYRLDKACKLLVSTSYPINTVSEMVGFEEYSVFYRAFFSKYGISPTDYREIKSAKFFIPPPNERPTK